LDSVGLGDTQGFVALDHTNQLIVVSFRGSQSIQNWISNLDVAMEPFSICSGCQAHSGFLDSWNSAKTTVQGAIDGAKAANPSYNIVATGHSLGAALATLAAADLRNSGYNIALVGCPLHSQSGVTDYDLV
jgi:predicted lipase